MSVGTHVSVAQKPQEVPYLMYWGNIAQHPEQTGVEPDSEAALLLGNEALKRFFQAQESEKVLRSILFGRAAIQQVGTEIYGSKADMLYETVQTWYRSLGPTNEMRAAQPLLEYAADVLQQAAWDQDVPDTGMFVLAGDLYHEAALQAQSREGFDELCEEAHGCYEQVVCDDSEGQSMVSQLANTDVSDADPRVLRSIARATGRYHDLKFLRMRPDMQWVFDSHDSSALFEGLLVESLRVHQLAALRDFRATLQIASKKGPDGRPLLPLELLREQFVVLAGRNELLTQEPRGREVKRLLEMSVRNAFPREAAPIGEMPRGLPSLRANVVIEEYDRIGQSSERGYYRTDVRPREQLAAGVLKLPWADTQPGGEKPLPLTVPNMLRWTNLLYDLVDVSPTNTGVRAAVREKMTKRPLPFTVEPPAKDV